MADTPPPSDDPPSFGVLRRGRPTRKDVGALREKLGDETTSAYNPIGGARSGDGRLYSPSGEISGGAGAFATTAGRRAILGDTGPSEILGEPASDAIPVASQTLSGTPAAPRRAAAAPPRSRARSFAHEDLRSAPASDPPSAAPSELAVADIDPAQRSAVGPEVDALVALERERTGTPPVVLDGVRGRYPVPGIDPTEAHDLHDVLLVVGDEQPDPVGSPPSPIPAPAEFEPRSAVSIEPVVGAPEPADLPPAESADPSASDPGVAPEPRTEFDGVLRAMEVDAGVGTDSLLADPEPVPEASDDRDAAVASAQPFSAPATDPNAEEDAFLASLLFDMASPGSDVDSASSAFGPQPASSSVERADPGIDARLPVSERPSARSAFAPRAPLPSGPALDAGEPPPPEVPVDPLSGEAATPLADDSVQLPPSGTPVARSPPVSDALPVDVSGVPPSSDPPAFAVSRPEGVLGDPPAQRSALALDQDDEPDASFDEEDSDQPTADATDDLLARPGVLSRTVAPAGPGAAAPPAELALGLSERVLGALDMSHRLRRDDTFVSTLAGLVALCAHFDQWVSQDVLSGALSRDEHWADAVVALLQDELSRRVYATSVSLPELIDVYRPSGLPDESTRVRAASEFLRRIGATTRDRRRESDLEAALLRARSDPLVALGRAYVGIRWPSLGVAVQMLSREVGISVVSPTRGRALEWTPYAHAIGMRASHLCVFIATTTAQELARQRRDVLGDGVLHDVDRTVEVVDPVPAVAVGLVLCDRVVLDEAADGTSVARVTVSTLAGATDEVDLRSAPQSTRAERLARHCGVSRFYTLFCAPRAGCVAVQKVSDSLVCAPLEQATWFNRLLELLDCRGLCTLGDA